MSLYRFYLPATQSFSHFIADSWAQDHPAILSDQYHNVTTYAHTQKAWTEGESVSLRGKKEITAFLSRCCFESYWIYICGRSEGYFLVKCQPLSNHTACPHTECVMTHKKWLLSWSTCALCRNTIKTHFSHPRRSSNRGTISSDVMYVIRFNVLAMFMPCLCLCPQDTGGIK